MVAWLLIILLLLDTGVSFFLIATLRQQSKRLDMHHDLIGDLLDLVRSILGGDHGI